MRSAISPRLAMSTLSKSCPGVWVATVNGGEARDARDGLTEAVPRSADHDERLPVLDWLAVLDQDRFNHAGAIGFDFVHQLHRFDDAKWAADLFLVPAIHQGTPPRRRR